MNKKIFIITFMLMLFLFVGFGSANEQSAKISISNAVYDENESIINYEHFEILEIKLGEEKVMDTKTFSLEYITNNGDKATFLVNYKVVHLNIHQSKIVDDMELTLISINELFDCEEESDDEESPVKVWIEPSKNDEKHLTVNGVNSFNPIDYGSDRGWTTTYEKEEVILFVERINTNKDVTFNMESDGNYERQIDNEKIKYYLRSNGEYKFITKYVNLGTWGGETDVEDTYMISISGLGETTTQSSSNDDTTMNDNLDDSKPIVEGDYRLNVGDSKNIITNEDGEWTLDTGYTINPNIANDKYVWTFDFSREGNYRPEFVSDSGEIGFVDFNIQPKEVTANVVQGTDNSSNAGKVIAVLGLILIVIGVFVFLQKKKSSKFSMKKSDSSSSVSPVEKDFI